jgi:hypothetical protein
MTLWNQHDFHRELLTPATGTYSRSPPKNHGDLLTQAVIQFKTYILPVVVGAPLWKRCQHEKQKTKSKTNPSC